MGKSIAIVSQKGGVGKTTLAANLATALAELEFSTLLVEADPQGSLLHLFGLDRYDLQHGVYSVIRGGEAVPDCIENGIKPYLDLLPANVWSHEEEVFYLETYRRNPLALGVVLEHIQEGYDYILVDSPPALGPITRAVLAAVDSYLIPVQAETMNLDTIARLQQLVHRAREVHNNRLQLEGVVVTMANLRTRQATEVLRRLSSDFPQGLFRTVIPRSIRVAEEGMKGRPTVAGAPRSPAGRAFQALAEELLARHIGGGEPSQEESSPGLEPENGGDPLAVEKNASLPVTANAGDDPDPVP